MSTNFMAAAGCMQEKRDTRNVKKSKTTQEMRGDTQEKSKLFKQCGYNLKKKCVRMTFRINPHSGIVTILADIEQKLENR